MVLIVLQVPYLNFTEKNLGFSKHGNLNILVMNWILYKNSYESYLIRI